MIRPGCPGTRPNRHLPSPPASGSSSPGSPRGIPTGGARPPQRRMADLAAPDERASMVSKLRSVRWASVVLGVGNLGVFSLGGCLVVASWPPGCSGGGKLSLAAVAAVAGARILAMFGVAFAQMETAATIANCLSESSDAADAVVRHERRVRYKRWLWWTRFGMVITMLQFVAALYLTIIILRDLSYGSNSRKCFLVQETETRSRKQGFMAFFLALVWIVVIIQCITGSDVLRWRSFYATHDTAWKAHYHEVFDHGIREALCCLGRVKYLSVLEEDEIYSVARLLGDLVAYRASGTGHLELLAGSAPSPDDNTKKLLFADKPFLLFFVFCCCVHFILSNSCQSKDLPEYSCLDQIYELDYVFGGKGSATIDHGIRD